eukprot:TRINITY_DN7260_c1_g1_i1.p1 TRINITY_DN7260_c1_g1~~TRINITY_DN7260_c1_g1_i1.p1  ORF type:complete len:100 (+),score=23.89 TRINITY_DN7260_c1_g1_i1:124-423(+)
MKHANGFSVARSQDPIPLRKEEKERKKREREKEKEKEEEEKKKERLFVHILMLVFNCTCQIVSSSTDKKLLSQKEWLGVGERKIFLFLLPTREEKKGGG